MDVDEDEEEEEETVLGSSNSEVCSIESHSPSLTYFPARLRIFPANDDSDPEEEERHLPPPSSLTQVAA
jgi:hypothetical protein